MLGLGVGSHLTLTLSIYPVPSLAHSCSTLLPDRVPVGVKRGPTRGQCMLIIMLTNGQPQGSRPLVVARRVLCACVFLLRLSPAMTCSWPLFITSPVPVFRTRVTFLLSALYPCVLCAPAGTTAGNVMLTVWLGAIENRPLPRRLQTGGLHGGPLGVHTAPLLGDDGARLFSTCRLLQLRSLKSCCLIGFMFPLHSWDSG